MLSSGHRFVDLSVCLSVCRTVYLALRMFWLNLNGLKHVKMKRWLFVGPHDTHCSLLLLDSTRRCCLPDCLIWNCFWTWQHSFRYCLPARAIHTVHVIDILFRYIVCHVKSCAHSFSILSKFFSSRTPLSVFLFCEPCCNL